MNKKVVLAVGVLTALGLGTVMVAARDGRAPSDAGFVAVSARPNAGVREIAPDEVAALARAPQHAGKRIIDVRETSELTDSLGHIEGVTHVPLAHVTHYASGWDPREPVVVVCRSGARSARAAEQLVRLGFRDVASMSGGMMAWNAQGLPVSRDLGDVQAMH